MRKISSLLRHPIFATVVTLLIIVTGLAGAIFSIEIRRAFPFYWGAGRLSPQASFFWILALISALAFFFREQSVSAEGLRIQREPLGRQRRSAHLIRTLPR